MLVHSKGQILEKIQLDYTISDCLDLAEKANASASGIFLLFFYARVSG